MQNLLRLDLRHGVFPSEPGYLLLWDRHLSSSMGANAVCSLLAAVAVTVLHGLTYGYWMGAAFTGVSTGLLCFALLQFCAHLVQKNRKKLDDEPEEK